MSQLQTPFDKVGTHTAFFYGTLMAPPVLYRVIYGTTKPDPWQCALTTVRPALLQGYRRHKVRHADYPAILPHGQAQTAEAEEEPKTSGTTLPSVRGSLVTGLLDEDIRRLDIFEGIQYIRRKVRVKVLKNTTLDAAIDESHLADLVEDEVVADTYVWQHSPRDLESEEWDFDVFRREKMWAWIGEAQRGQDGNAGVQVAVDEGFRDVDEDVARRTEMEAGKDPTGGRGVNGKIGKELEETRRPAV